MGDKISALPAATSVDGTELVPIVQGGATKKVTGLILRNPVGAAGGDITGSYPNPTLAAITTAQTAVGGPAVIPVLTIDQKGRVVSLTTVAASAVTSTQFSGLSTNAPAALATTAIAGVSTYAAKADHQHLFPTAAQVGAQAAGAAAGGDLVGNYPSPTLAAITTAQTAVGSGLVIPVISTDSKGRVTALATVACPALTSAQIAGLSTTAPAALATSAVVGLSTFAARADHQHVLPTVGEIGALSGLTGDVVATGPGTVAATLASITTAQSNVGSGTLVPVLSIDAKGRVTALGSTPISGSAGGTVTSITAGTGLSGGTITSSGTISIAAVTTAQSNVGSSSLIPVLSINAQGQITQLSTVAAESGGALATTPPAALATTAVVGLSTFAARADHQHILPSASEVGALGATATAGGDLTGNYPSPTLAAITTAQSNVGSSTQIPIISIDAKGRVTALSSVAASSQYFIEFLIIAGGGSGGSAGGGGGGGVITNTSSVSPGSVYPIVIGAGGASVTGSVFGNNGSNTTGFSSTALGGGGGGSWSSTADNQAGRNGGSGGGGGLNIIGSTNPGGSGTSGQGFAGGSANQAYTTGYAAGGGGGAGAVGANKSNQVSGAGGIGVLNAINGTSLYWAGGGGAGAQQAAATAGNGGTGGGGGGAGASSATAGTGGGSALNSGGNGNTSGVGGTGGTNTGGGGGAMGINIGTGASGGSGIVVLRYAGTQRGTGGTVTSSGGYTIHTFTTSGNFTA
jgi:hypothetical protein